MTPEGKVRTYLRKRIIETKGEHRKLRWIGRRNAPDEFAFWAHTQRHCWFECKAPGEEPTPAQDREIQRMRQAGLIVFVVDGVEAIEQFLRTMV